MTERPGFMIYHDKFKDATEGLTDAEIGQIVCAAFRFSISGDVQSFEDRAVQKGFVILRNSIEADSQRYERIRRQNQEKGKLSAEYRRNGQPQPTAANHGQPIQPTINSKQLSSNKKEPQPTTANSSQPQPTTADSSWMDAHKLL